jgi:hypothetical protein
MATKYKIKLDKNNRKEIVIESVRGDVKKKDSTDKFEFNENNFFYEEYKKAEEIINSIRISYQDPKEQNSEKPKDSSPILLKNNIITFTGSRGTGKTSAMVSFGKDLEQQKEYKVLDLIDPSHFGKNESILLNVIILLFKSVKTHLKDTKIQPSNDLLKKFETVFKAVKSMDELVPKESSLEYLDQLSDSLNLVESIKKLIDDSLDFFKKGTDSKHDSDFKYLVLMIDDLDTNVAHAPKMLEQIRKFLIHKNLIILLSTNIDQLQLEMQEYYSKYFQRTFSLASPAAPKSDVCAEVEEMATKYLLKLLPPLQRIHIGNSANKLLNTTITIEIDKADSNKNIAGDLQKVVLSLIWEKTRLIFIPRKSCLHPIIPTNLRALNQFILMLVDMEEVERTESSENKMFQNDNEYKSVRENFLKFKDYILNVWIPSNLAFEEQQIFDNIPKDISRINKHLIQSINVIGAKHKEKLLVKPLQMYKEERKEKDLDGDIYTFVSRNDPRFSMANKISDVYNFPSNNSMGDILLLIDKYKTYFESENNNNFIEAIKIYYSLLLFETMFFDEDSKFKISEPEEITNIQKLIGGTLYFPYYFEIIKDKTYDIIVNTWKEIKEKNEKIKDENKKKDDDRLIQELLNTLKENGVLLNTITDEQEFIKKYSRGEGRGDHLFYHESGTDYKNPLFILYYGKSRPERSYSRHIYETTVKEEGNEHVRFDILSLLVNILNPFHTLYRHSNNDEEYKQACKNSKYEKWLYKTEDEKFITNILLPIYSVDLMLFYLKNPVACDDVLSKDDKKAIEEKTNVSEILICIEEKMREISTISNYYQKLLQLTKEKLARIEDDKKMISERLEKIYKNSAKEFLKDEAEQEASQKRRGRPRKLTL